MHFFLVLNFLFATTASQQAYIYSHPWNLPNPGPNSIKPSTQFVSNYPYGLKGFNYNRNPTNHFHQYHSESAQTFLETAPKPIITKYFYFHSAPEEKEEVHIKRLTIGPPRKNYHVIFIKAPSNTGRPTKISLTQPQQEDRTVIYVLVKKTDPANIETEVDIPPSRPIKPEVFFIRYKTQEEAALAQQQIQAQYDILGGTTQVSDESVASVSSVIGALGKQSTSNSGIPSHSSVINSAAYLPNL